MNIDILFDEKYRFENGQLLKKVTNYTLCSENEVINYYKDKAPLVFVSNKELYLLSNDKINAINPKRYTTTPVTSLFISEIFIIAEYRSIQVWKANIEITFSFDECNDCIDYGDGFILQNGYLMKTDTRDWMCSGTETKEFFKKIMKINNSNIDVEYDKENNRIFVIPEGKKHHTPKINWG